MAVIETIPSFSSPPSGLPDGTIAYALDTTRHYMLVSGTLYLIPIMADGAKSWVSGSLKSGTFSYFSKATTASGVVTFYLTDNGLSTGNAVYNTIEADSIVISPYGAGAVYQVSAPTVSVDKKSITATINQVTAVVLGLIQISSAANGVDCRMLVIGE